MASSLANLRVQPRQFNFLAPDVERLERSWRFSKFVTYLSLALMVVGVQAGRESLSTGTLIKYLVYPAAVGFPVFLVAFSDTMRKEAAGVSGANNPMGNPMPLSGESHVTRKNPPPDYGKPDTSDTISKQVLMGNDMGDRFMHPILPLVDSHRVELHDTGFGDSGSAHWRKGGSMSTGNRNSSYYTGGTSN